MTMRAIGKIDLRAFHWRIPHIPTRCKGLGDDAGGALVEMGVMLSLLGVPLLLGMICVATLLFDWIEISNAAHTGAMYAMRSANLAADGPGTIAAARAEASDFGNNLTVTPTFYFACSNAVAGTQYATQALAAPACNGGSSSTLEFVKVVASATVTPLGKVPGIAHTVILSNTSVMEVQE